MGFVDAVKSFYKRYVDFQGRSSRSEYWWVQLFYMIVMCVLFIPFFAFLGSNEDVAMMALIPLGLFLLASVLPLIAVTVRRFHDQDKSGWMYLLSFIPYVGGIVIIIFMCLGGTPGTNRFGADPLGRGIDDTFS